MSQCHYQSKRQAEAALPTPMILTLTAGLHSLPLSRNPISSPTTLRFRFKPRLQASSTPQLSSKPQSLSRPNTGVIVVGAGLAGLSAATHFHSNNIPFLLIEASDAVGGRVLTDSVDGFLLDRGFQIFITAYPEAQKLLDYRSLDLALAICSWARVGSGFGDLHPYSKMKAAAHPQFDPADGEKSSQISNRAGLDSRLELCCSRARVFLIRFW